MRRRASISKGNYLAPHWRRKWALRGARPPPTCLTNIWHHLRRGYKEKSSRGFWWLRARLTAIVMHGGISAHLADIEPKPRPLHILLIGMISNEVRHFRLFSGTTNVGYLRYKALISIAFPTNVLLQRALVVYYIVKCLSLIYIAYFVWDFIISKLTNMFM